MRGLRTVLSRLDEPPTVNRLPFQLWLMLACFNAGVGILLANEPPNSMMTLVWTPLVYVWVVGLVAFPVVMIYSLLMENRIDGLRLECYLLGPFGLCLLVYPVAAIEYAGMQSIVSAFFSICAGISCLTTAILIRKKLKELGLWTPPQ